MSMINIHVLAQEVEIETKSDEEEAPEKFIISVSMSLTYVPAAVKIDNLSGEGHFVPGIGIDFFYRLSPKWEIGTIVDYEFSHYLIPRKDDLEREKAIIATLTGAYTFDPRWNVFFGAGAEFERHEHLFVFKLGVEHVVPLENSWFIPICFFFDFKEGYDAWSISIGIGKGF